MLVVVLILTVALLFTFIHSAVSFLTYKMSPVGRYEDSLIQIEKCITRNDLEGAIKAWGEGYRIYARYSDEIDAAIESGEIDISYFEEFEFEEEDEDDAAGSDAEAGDEDSTAERS